MKRTVTLLLVLWALYACQAPVNTIENFSPKISHNTQTISTPSGYESTWMGSYAKAGVYAPISDTNGVWIRHLELGKIYISGQTTNNILPVNTDTYLWDSRLNWLFTKSTLYPYFYSLSQAAWLYYFFDNATRTRWFYNFTSNQWSSFAAEEIEPFRRLRVNPNNPRYFIDSEGKSKFLTGPYDMSAINYPLINAMNGKANYMRIGMTPKDRPSTNGALGAYKRIPNTGYTSNGNLGKFDLTQFDEQFFSDLASFIAKANEYGIVIHISIFNDVVLNGRNDACCGFRRNVFYQGNNINENLIGHVDRNGDGSGTGTDEFTDAAALYGYIPASYPGRSQRLKVAELQKLFVDKILNTTKYFPNVMYEVGNELDYKEWVQYWVNYIKARTSAPVTVDLTAFSGNASGFSNVDGFIEYRIHFDSTSCTVNSFNDSLSKATGVDTDDGYVEGRWDIDRLRKVVWLSFASGYQIFGHYDEEALRPIFNVNNLLTSQLNYFSILLDFMDLTSIDLQTMSKHNNLAYSQKNNEAPIIAHCLTEIGEKYFVYTQKTNTKIKIDLRNVNGTFKVIWFNPINGAHQITSVTAGDWRTLSNPYSAYPEVALYLVRQ